MQANPPSERRKRNIPAATDRRKPEPAEAKPEPPCPPPFEDEATRFMKAMERYKRENRRPFPTWSEVLEVLRALGYRKVGAETDLPGTKTEPPMAPLPPKG